MRSASLSF
ncbi:hypothetical protein HU200_012951 [Digitaria exilis]|uniref:Uncharacterized protein n=1 Tax=Digitaria exilis TaxID=1010633 RepID=A0A835FD95_9POAL|nr:hypothetical protein HU200_012951 [Digitaria exilis]